jgi:hypothetical protein
VDELSFAADRCPCVEKLRTCYQLLLASETVQCSVVGVRLGQCRHISMSKLGSIITSALTVATMLICQRACNMCWCVCVAFAV